MIPVLGHSIEPRKVSFTATDGLKVTGDLYMPWEKSAPFIVLFHRAAWSRGEYVPIAPKLNEMGYNCLAVDQRSGSRVYGKQNDTAHLAAGVGKGTEYLDAVPDMAGALQYARDNYAGSKLIGWGSSYSAGLIIVIAAEEEGLVDGVVAFSPGEYFERFDMGESYVADHAAKLKMPVFMACRQVERANLDGLKNALPKDTPARAFIPEGVDGTHGSQALWPESKGNEQYWSALSEYLGTYFPSEDPKALDAPVPAKLRRREPISNNGGDDDAKGPRNRFSETDQELPQVAPDWTPIPRDPESVPAGKPKEEKAKGPAME